MLGQLPNLKMLKYSNKNPLAIRPGGFKKLEVLYMGGGVSRAVIASVLIRGNLQLAFPALKHLCFSSGLITVDRTLTATSKFEDITTIRVGSHFQRYRDKVQWHFDGYDEGVALFCAESGRIYRRFTAPYSWNGFSKSDLTIIEDPISPAYDGPAFDNLQAAGSRVQRQTIAKVPRVTIVADKSHYPRDVRRNLFITPSHREPLRSPAPPYLPTRCPSPPPRPIVHVPDDIDTGDSENDSIEEFYESPVDYYDEDSEGGVSEESNESDVYSDEDDDVNEVNDHLDDLYNYYQINSNNWLRPNPFPLI